MAKQPDCPHGHCVDGRLELHGPELEIVPCPHCTFQHVYATCTRETCPGCHGRGSTDALQDDPLSAVTCQECGGHGTTSCGGCRPDSGLDCRYESLAHCTVCGCMEGGLLPFCPGRWVTMAEQDAFYAHYCAGTGPFAKATRDTIDVARCAAHQRYMHAIEAEPYTGSAYVLYLAVCELWELVVEQNPPTLESRR